MESNNSDVNGGGLKKETRRKGGRGACSLFIKGSAGPVGTGLI
jgi:hypothetical protein